MKTSIDISDNLFSKVRNLAKKRGTSVRALVEEGLRSVLEAQEQRGQVQPKLLTFDGDGLTERFAGDSSWEALRDEIYRGHGA